MTLNDAVEYVTFHDYPAIIATSKSHQKEKKSPSGIVTPPCDRYRLVIELDKTITDTEEYSFMMRDIAKQLPIDKSCKDTARFFYPSPGLHYTHHGLSPFKTMNHEELMFRKHEERKKEKKLLIRNAAIADKSMLPPRLINILRYGGKEGHRHATAYLAGAELSKFGWDHGSILTELQKTNLADIGIPDLSRAIKNGIKGASQNSIF